MKFIELNAANKSTIHNSQTPRFCSPKLTHTAKLLNNIKIH